VLADTPIPAAICLHTFPCARRREMTVSLPVIVDGVARRRPWHDIRQPDHADIRNRTLTPRSCRSG
jgi:hypothetical protein